jgi:ATP-binding cassette subfamily B multidrug efflux pump
MVWRTTGYALIAFVNYLMRTLMSMMFVSMLTMRLARAQASAERVQEILDSEPEVKNAPKAITDFTPAGKVVFENVTFSYDGDGQDPVLKGISFTAEPGQTVAILGATGSGKSSLIHLIPRFYDVTEGRITLIGVALQDSILFTGKIKDNIRYGRPDADDSAVIAAAEAAQAHDFISTFPDGYDTELGQRGVNLSGGQKQRMAIARALLTEPAVLVLDDSTSSVDVETETKIQEALETIMKNRTSFVVAQRISTVLTADKILVLDDGEIVAEGTHSELLSSSPIYREIYDSQLGNGVANYV